MGNTGGPGRRRQLGGDLPQRIYWRLAWRISTLRHGLAEEAKPSCRKDERGGCQPLVEAAFSEFVEVACVVVPNCGSSYRSRAGNLAKTDTWSSRQARRHPELSFGFPGETRICAFDDPNPPATKKP